MRLATCAITCIASASLPIISTGCAPQDRYDDLMTTNRSLREQLVVVEEQRDEARASLRIVQDRLAQMETSYDDLQQRYTGLGDALTRMETDNDQLLQRIASQQMGPLPDDVELALSRVAAAYPDLLTFDARTGMLRFAADLTFNSGRATVRPEAEETVRQIAQILQAPTARGLEIRVVGHTDSEPIQHAKTRGHPTNMHLSVHRAIAVRDALITDGIDAARIQAAGYGEFRPLVPNNPDGRTPVNRRVEMYLVPMPSLDIRVTATPAPDASASAEPAEEEPMK